MKIYKEELMIWRELYVAECSEQNKEPIEIGQWERELKAQGLVIIDRKSLENEYMGTIR
jgi:hypothetical protein